jgi:hypothetical protein
MKMASSRNVPCWYQGCALDSQENRSLELISHSAVKMRSMNEATAGWQSSPEAQGVIYLFKFCCCFFYLVLCNLACNFFPLLVMLGICGT